jgi:hypothetical protein
MSNVVPVPRSLGSLGRAGSAPPGRTAQSEQSPAFRRSCRSESLPPLGPATLEHEPATLGLHPRPEPMYPAAANPARLIGALHECETLRWRVERARSSSAVHEPGTRETGNLAVAPSPCQPETSATPLHEHEIDSGVTRVVPSLRRASRDRGMLAVGGVRSSFELSGKPGSRCAVGMLNTLYPPRCTSSSSS